MPNQSKVEDNRFWRRWYASGAVKQPELKPEDEKITAVAIHHSGPAAGYSVLSLGEKIVGPNAIKPNSHIAVPSHKFELGQRLKKYPSTTTPLFLLF